MFSQMLSQSPNAGRVFKKQTVDKKSERFQKFMADVDKHAIDARLYSPARIERIQAAVLAKERELKKSAVDLGMGEDEFLKVQKAAFEAAQRRFDVDSSVVSARHSHYSLMPASTQARYGSGNAKIQKAIDFNSALGFGDTTGRLESLLGREFWEQDQKENMPDKGSSSNSPSLAPRNRVKSCPSSSTSKRSRSSDSSSRAKSTLKQTSCSQQVEIGCKNEPEVISCGSSESDIATESQSPDLNADQTKKFSSITIRKLI